LLRTTVTLVIRPRTTTSMSTQIRVFQVETLGAMPAALLILMLILAALGIVANVAAA
jgi:hypothetical protein